MFGRMAALVIVNELFFIKVRLDVFINKKITGEGTKVLNSSYPFRIIYFF